MRIAEQQVGIVRGLAKRLLPVALGIALIISLIFPAVFYTLLLDDLDRAANIYAEHLGHQLAFVLSESPALWKYQTAKYLQILDEFIPEKGLAVVRVLDEAGRPIPEYTHTVEPPDRWGPFRPHVGKASLLLERRLVGTVEVAVSQGPLLKQSLMVFLGCALVGIGLAAVTYLYPVKIAARLEGRLKESVEAVERANERLEALVKANRTLTASLDMNETLQTILHEAASISDSPMVRLLLLDEEGKALRLRVSEGLPPDATTGLAIPVGESFSGQVAATREPLVVADTRGDSRELYPEDAIRYGLVSYLGLPVKQGEQLFGVLAFHTNSPRTYSPEEIELLLAFAAQAAIAIANARLHEVTVRRGEQLETIRAVSIEITRELDLGALLHLITGRVVELIGGGQSMIRLWDEDGQWLVPRAYAGNDARWADRRVRLGEGVAGTAAQRREGIIVNDFRTSPYAIPVVTEDSTHSAVLTEPLLFGDRLVGVLSITREADQRPFTEQDRQLLALVATQAAIAIENARLHEEAVKRGRQLGALLRSTQSVMSGLDLEETLQTIVREAAAMSGAPVIRLLLLDEVGQHLRYRTGIGTPQEEEAGLVIPVGESFSGQVIATGQPLMVPDVREDPRLVHRRRADEDGLSCYLGLPIKRDATSIGVLVFNSATLRVYSKDEIKYLGTFAQQAAIAIENARLHESVVQRAQQLASLTRLTQSLVASMSVEKVGEEVMIAVQSLMPRTAARLWNVTGDDLATLEVIASAGLQDTRGGTVRFRRGEGLAGVAVDSRRPVISQDVSRDPRFMNKGWAAQEKLVSAILFPLLIGEKIHGILAIFTREPHDFSETEIALLQSLATHAAIAIENATLHASALSRSTELEALLLASRAIGSSLDSDQVLQAIVQRAAAISAAPVVRLFLLDEAAQLLRCRIAVGFPLKDEPELAIPVGTSFSGQVAATGEPLAVADTRGDRRTYYSAHVIKYGVVSYLGLPVKFQDRVLGVLVFNTPAPRRYSAGELVYLSSFAAQAAIAIENARLHEEVIQHAETLEARVRERTTELARTNLELTAALRQAEAGNQAKNDFLINMSHELRTPLNAVLGFAQLLQEQAKGGLTDKQRRYLDNIYNSGQHLLALVNEILDLNTAEEGLLTLHLSKVNLADVILEALDATREAARRKGHAVHALIPPDLPVFEADRDRIRQIAICLLSNAVKFTPDGGTISVAARRISNFQCPMSNLKDIGLGPQSQIANPKSQMPPPPSQIANHKSQLHDFVEIAVTDTGIGIRAEDLPRLFRMFGQLESPLTKRYEGTGVGLALARRLIALHGGTITASSEGEGKGSTFTVRLPIGGPNGRAEE